MKVSQYYKGIKLDFKETYLKTAKQDKPALYLSNYPSSWNANTLMKFLTDNRLNVKSVHPMRNQTTGRPYFSSTVEFDKWSSARIAFKSEIIDPGGGLLKWAALQSSNASRNSIN